MATTSQRVPKRRSSGSLKMTRQSKSTHEAQLRHQVVHHRRQISPKAFSFGRVYNQNQELQWEGKLTSASTTSSVTEAARKVTTAISVSHTVSPITFQTLKGKTHFWLFYTSVPISGLVAGIKRKIELLGKLLGFICGLAGHSL